MGLVCNLKYYCFRIRSSEDVQYFQFDSDGNMYVFEPGAGMSGECVRVEPGFEVNVTQNWYSSAKELTKSCTQFQEDSVCISDCHLSNSSPTKLDTKGTSSKRFILCSNYFLMLLC